MRHILVNESFEMDLSMTVYMSSWANSIDRAQFGLTLMILPLAFEQYNKTKSQKNTSNYVIRNCLTKNLMFPNVEIWVSRQLIARLIEDKWKFDCCENVTKDGLES